MTAPIAYRPRRILMTADAVGGIWDYALELAGRLSRRGISVTLAVMGTAPTEAQVSQAEAIPGLALHHGRFKLEWMAAPEHDLADAGDWLLELADRCAPDLIHLNGYTHAALPWRRPIMAVAHSCVLSWWLAVHGEPAPTNWQPYARRVAAGLGAADMVVAPTRAMLDAISTLYNVPTSPRVIWNGRDPGDWRPWDVKQPIILSAGRLWDEAKNIQALELVASHLDWPVVVAGNWQRPDGTGTPPEHLHYLGRLPSSEMAEWYGKAGIFALPARYEPFGLSILEAALSGCALVLGDIPSLRELWADAAIFVPPDDPDSLTHALRRLIADPAFLSAQGNLARRHARRYGTERMVMRYLDAYAELLDATQPVPPHHDKAAVQLGSRP